MTQAVGSKTRIIISKESTFNTVPTLTGAGTVAGIVMPYTTESIQEGQNLIDDSNLKTSRDRGKPARGNRGGQGDLNFLLNPNMYAILAHTMGGRSSTWGAATTIAENVASATTGPYTHTFTIGDLPTSFTLEKKFTSLATDEFHQFRGCRVQSLTFNLGSEGFVNCTANIMTSDFTSSASSMSGSGGTVNAYDKDFSDQPWDMFSLPAGNVKVYDSSGAAATVAYISDFSFTIENNLDGSMYVVGGAGARQSLPENQVKVSGTLTANFQDTAGADSSALVAQALAGTENTIDLTFTRGTGTGDDGNEYFQILLNEVQFTRGSPNVSGPAGVKVELPFIAYVDGGANTTLQMVLKNAHRPQI